ncbi:MAG: bifunctional metallophosphatase/5'-nucleotidase [Nocardioidaceae bacterium]
MTRLARGARRSRLAAFSVAALTSVATLSTVGNVAPAAAKDAPTGTQVQTRPAPPPLIDLQVLALNDFHGQLEQVPSTSSSGRIGSTPAGGAEYLATHLERLRADARDRGAHSVTVAAGDLVGATPLLSAAFYDEPTIEALNGMGLDISSVGNHEFDQGWRELVRKQEGGCVEDGPDGRDNRNSCPAGDFMGADFQYLSANVFHEGTGETVLPAVEVKEYDGAKVGFIGMTLENTPNIVTQSGIEGLRFTDEVETANRLANQLYKQGVKSVVVLVHEGGYPADSTAYNSCPGISGPILDINQGLSSKIDAVITGHTHQAYNCSLLDPAGQPRLVTSSSSLGRIVTEIDLNINSRSGEIVRESAVANNNIVTRDVAKDSAMTELIAKYKELVSDIESKVIGTFADGVTSVSRTQDDSGESPLGNLIADAQRNDASTITNGRAPEIAVMNPGGIRADLAADGSGNVTYGAAFSTQPFNNYVVSMDMTGDQVLTLLEQQWSGVNAGSPKVLQVSGITYTWSRTAAAGSKLVPGSVQVNGQPLDPAQTYRVAANSFLADGGDGFSVFRSATGKYFGGLDIDALAAYLGQHPDYTPQPTDRIDVQQ